jgi:G3E family GTPase
MAVPVHCITGLEALPMEAATVGLQWDLPRAVVVRHALDVAAGTLVRIVSDVTGVLEREVIEVGHLCLSCALREDIVPTLERLAALERWDSIIAHLPIGLDAAQLCRMISLDQALAAELRVAGVVMACESASLPDLLVTDDLLAERALHTSATDRRGVAEVAARLVEYADVIAAFDASGSCSARGEALVRALARPGALVVSGWPGLRHQDLITGLHHHGSSEEWVADVFTAPMGDLDSEHVWRMDLIATDPLDPSRFLDRLEDLGAGPHRTRGFLWVPTRPEDVIVWQGAGGQVSIGASQTWAGRPRHSRIVVTGLHDSGDDRDTIRQAFHASLVSEHDRATRGISWQVIEDGLEPWLGDIPGAA